jgi:hypothetical protein
MNSSDNSRTIVQLDVGGKKFKTLRSTLLHFEGSYFTGLLECDSPPNGEYFIDRDGDSFVPILKYLRNKGICNDYIDPLELSFYALPLPSLSFHQVVQKDVAIVREFLEKYQHEILADLTRYFKLSQGEQGPNGLHLMSHPEKNSVSWILLKGLSWTEQNRKFQQNPQAYRQDYGPNAKLLDGYEAALLNNFTPTSSLFRTLLSEAEHFWLPQGLFCSFKENNHPSARGMNGGDTWTIHFSWKH